MISIPDNRRAQQVPPLHAGLDEWPNLALNVNALGGRTRSNEPSCARQIEGEDKRHPALGAGSFLNAALSPNIRTSNERPTSRVTEPITTCPGLLGSSQDPYPPVQAARIDLLDFAALETAAGRRDLRSFVAAEQIVNWRKRSATELAKAIQYALSLGAFAVAQQLAQVGAREHGDDPVVKRLARMLAPAKVLRANLPPDPRVLQNHEWLKKHASEYRKRWVALENGNLLFSGDSISEVRSKVGARKGVLFMRIP